MSQAILIVAAHPDDEVIGCGGTIAWHVARGDHVAVAVLADGVTSRSSAGEVDSIARDAAFRKSAEVLGVSQLFSLGFPDNRLDSVPLLDIVQALESVLQEVMPESVYTHHAGDLNVDHRIAHQAVLTACRPFPGQGVRSIYSFEVLSSTEWNTPGERPFFPSVFVDVTPYVRIKLAALAAYRDEMRMPPHSRSEANIQNLLAYRGHSVGFNSAEAFVLVRQLVS